MRPSDKPTGAVWRVLEEWAAREQERDDLKRRVTQMTMVERFGVKRSIISHWKYMTSRMQMDDLLRIVETTDITFDELSKALEEDEPFLARNVIQRRTGRAPSLDE